MGITDIRLGKVVKCAPLVFLFECINVLYVPDPSYGLCKLCDRRGPILGHYVVHTPSHCDEEGEGEIMSAARQRNQFRKYKSAAEKRKKK